MVSANILAATLQIAAGVAAGYGAWRCMRLQRFGRDARLTALMWFFGLFALSVFSHAVWEVQIGQALPGGPGGLEGNITFGERDGFLRPSGMEGVSIWLVLHHALMAASLAVGVVAFSRHRPQNTQAAALTPLAFFSDLIPLLLALQAALTLYLAARAWLNHMERKTPGALQVALGFLLFFIGHLTFFLAHRPGRGREGIGDILTLVGIILLVQVLPGRR